jgi:hypothetical protein
VDRYLDSAKWTLANRSSRGSDRARISSVTIVIRIATLRWWPYLEAF